MSITDLILKLANLSCPKCGHAFSADDIKKAQSQINSGVLVCPKCQHLISSGNGHSSHSIDKTGYKASAEINYIQNYNGSFEFTISWRSKISIFLLLFGLIWIGFTGFFLLMLINSGGATINGVYTTDVSKILSSLSLFIIPGIIILFISIVQLINKRKIIVNQNEVSFFDGPIWKSKITKINPQYIHNLSLRHQSNGEINGERIFTNIVDIHLKNGDVIKLCNINTMSDAIFIEQTIEKFFGIVDDKNLDQLKAF